MAGVFFLSVTIYQTLLTQGADHKLGIVDP